MKKHILLAAIILLISVMFTGCLSVQIYRSSFNDAVRNQKSAMIITTSSFEDSFNRIVDKLVDLGYEETLYHHTEEGFLVVSKPANLIRSLVAGTSSSHVIILKFTDWEPGETRVDLVNHGQDLFAMQSVAKDIEQIVAEFS